MQPLRQTTLCFLIRNEEVLLAMKKRGFGVNKWNGVGGKPNEGEEIKQAAIRETQEEIEVIVKDIEARAVLNFYFIDHPEWNQQTIVYFAQSWEGAPTETDEMRPAWFKKNELPLNDMWPVDRHWLPVVLGGEKIKAECLLDENGEVLDFTIEIVDKL
ncbi:MAG: 8-oxo-dGTP diphosphatase [Microgenomates group bacterium]